MDTKYLPRKKQYAKTYYKKNKKKVDEYKKQYIKENKDKVKKYMDEYYQDNKDKWKGYQKIRETNPDYHASMRRRYHKNKDKIKITRKEPKVRFRIAKYVSRIRGFKWLIKFEDYVKLIKEPCFYCSTSLSKETGVGLDRINNKKNYNLKNVLPCCGDCNSVRHHILTVDETQIAMLAVLNYRIKENKNVR